MVLARFPHNCRGGERVDEGLEAGVLRMEADTIGGIAVLFLFLPYCEVLRARLALTCRSDLKVWTDDGWEGRVKEIVPTCNLH